MAQATRLNLDSTPGLARPVSTPHPGNDAQLRETLKHCTPSTYNAACRFRETGRPEYLPAIVHGIIARYVDPELRRQLRAPEDELRLKEDLGLDSLTLMEIVIRLEDVLQISVRDDELRQFHTLGEVRRLVERTVTTDEPVVQPPAPTPR